MKYYEYLCNIDGRMDTKEDMMDDLARRKMKKKIQMVGVPILNTNL